MAFPSTTVTSFWRLLSLPSLLWWCWAICILLEHLCRLDCRVQRMKEALLLWLYDASWCRPWIANVFCYLWLPFPPLPSPPLPSPPLLRSLCWRRRQDCGSPRWWGSSPLLFGAHGLSNNSSWLPPHWNCHHYYDEGEKQSMPSIHTCSHRLIWRNTPMYEHMHTDIHKHIPIHGHKPFEMPIHMHNNSPMSWC